MIPLPKKPEIQKKEGNRATFVIEGLYPGYGVTVGNSLRRVLLSSLEGAAITKVKIKDVSHEFSTLPGVMEDGIVILLNLKGVHFKLFGEEPVTATLKTKGEKKVTAGEFELPSQLELVNKDHHIATLTDKKASLEMEVEVDKGIGYEPAERRSKEEREESEIGLINLDAIYTPVTSVSFRVENMRVGKRTDFDRLILDIETDGRTSPEQAFQDAVKILEAHFSELEIEVPEPEEEEDPSEILIDELEISGRVANILKENRIKTAAGLVARTEENISETDGIGPKSLKEIKKALKKRGLELR